MKDVMRISDTCDRFGAGLERSIHGQDSLFSGRDKMGNLSRPHFAGVILAVKDFIRGRKSRRRSPGVAQRVFGGTSNDKNVSYDQDPLIIDQKTPLSAGIDEAGKSSGVLGGLADRREPENPPLLGGSGAEKSGGGVPRANPREIVPEIAHVSRLGAATGLVALGPGSQEDGQRASRAYPFIQPTRGRTPARSYASPGGIVAVKVKRASRRTGTSFPTGSGRGAGERREKSPERRGFTPHTARLRQGVMFSLGYFKNQTFFIRSAHEQDRQDL